MWNFVFIQELRHSATHPVSQVQMDIRGQHSRDALIKRLWNRLTDDGILVLVENGTPTGFRFMHHTRELFINRLGTDKFHFVPGFILR